MNAPSTLREALIAETLGEIEMLIERVEALKAELDASRSTVSSASADLAAQATAFESRMVRMADAATLSAAKHIAQRTNDMARALAESQRHAMEAAAREAFRKELGPPLHRLATPLQRLVTQVEGAARPWRGLTTWIAHAATAALSCGITWTLCGYLAAR